MDDNATRRVEPTDDERQRNREREMMGFNLGLWGVAAVVVILIVLGIWLVL
ncbi:MAG TPA: hypothetical protein VFV93_07545 [Thermomicrobiales bacterium]|nr:hypothetical protein [Thermomicrobiales bacterium]